MLGRKTRLLLGLLFSTGIGLLAYRRGSLTRSGVGGAILSGTTIFGMGGWAWGLSLIYFFVSSSLLSHFREREKEHTAADKFSKGSQRDFGQAVANGGVATMMAVGYGSAIHRAPTFGNLAQAGFVGALATANADTWATEVGVLSRHEPRLVTTGKVVAPGTSGGMTVLGTGAAALGALSLGMVFWVLEQGEKLFQYSRKEEDEGRGRGAIHRGRESMDEEARGNEQGAMSMGCSYPISSIFISINRPPTAGIRFVPVLALVSGLAGCLFDSVLGATVQAIYYCPKCKKETERSVHSCGTRTVPLRGISWLNNDVVNFAATVLGAMVAMVIQRLTA